MQRFVIAAILFLLIIVLSPLKLFADNSVVFEAKYITSNPCAVTLDLNNSATTPLRKVLIHASIPEALKLKIKNLPAPWQCQWGKGHTLSCHYPEIPAHTSAHLQFKIECQVTLDDSESINFFLKAKREKEQIEDVAMLPLTNPDQHDNHAILDWSAQVSSDSIYKEKNVTFALHSSQAQSIQVHCDEGLKLLENSACRKISGEGSLSCAVEAGSIVELHAKAMQYGLKICDFSDGKVTRSIPVEVQRSYIPHIDLHIKPNRTSIFEGEDLIVDLDLNSSQLTQRVDDTVLKIKADRAEDFTFEKIEGEGWECAQSSKSHELRCKKAEILPKENEQLRFHFKANSASSESGLTFELHPNSTKMKPQHIAVSIVGLNFKKSHLAQLEPKIHMQSKGRIRIINGSFYRVQETEGLSHAIETLPHAKLFFEPKKRLILPIERNSSETLKLAKLYWGGRIAIRDLDQALRRNLYQLSYKLENEKEYHHCIADTDALFWKRDGDMLYYQASCDIEDALKGVYKGNLEIKSSLLHAGFGAIGSAQLLTITDQNGSVPPHRYTIYEGFEGVWDAPFAASRSYHSNWQLDLKGLGTLDRLSLGILGGDRGYGDQLLLSRGEKKLFEKKDILVNSQSVDLDLEKDLNLTELPDRVSIESLGDRFFLFRVVATSSQAK